MSIAICIAGWMERWTELPPPRFLGGLVSNLFRDVIVGKLEFVIKNWNHLSVNPIDI